VLAIVKLASEEKEAISDPTFYNSALKFIKTLPVERGYLAAEDVAQSAAIACVKDETFYKETVDYILTPKNIFGVEYLTSEAINSACRVLASIAITNGKYECDKINSEAAFVLALERITNSWIYQEKRREEKTNRMVEVFEQALEAKIDVDTARSMFEKVYYFIKLNEDLSKEYKLKTLTEITKKAIKTPGLSHTKIFTDIVSYLKQHKENNTARSITVLLDINKK
jgi:hypothetical protein